MPSQLSSKLFLQYKLHSPLRFFATTQVTNTFLIFELRSMHMLFLNSVRPIDSNIRETSEETPVGSRTTRNSLP